MEKDNGAFFKWLGEHSEELKNRKHQSHLIALRYAVKRCCEIKGRIVASDEREDGERALLNLGHTIGHAIEHVLGFGEAGDFHGMRN